MKDKLVAIVGPTAVGKTRFAIETAEEYGGEIVSCDSMQLYKYMDIGSAKPTREELSRIKHHLVDVIDPAEPFSAAQYQKLAKEAISDILTRHKLPVISGGTGLYLDSLIYELDFSNDSCDPQLRERLKKIACTEGSQAVHRILESMDPDAAELIHPNNLKRAIRAIERLSSGEDKLKPFDHGLLENGDYDWILVGLTRERNELYDRINERVDKLVEEGLINEVQGLMDIGLSYDDISMKGIGYKEIIEYLNGKYNLETAIDNVKKNTRHYAKRQLTWYRRYDKIHWLNISDYADDEEAAEELKNWLRQRI